MEILSVYHRSILLYKPSIVISLDAVFKANSPLILKGMDPKIEPQVHTLKF